SWVQCERSKIHLESFWKREIDEGLSLPHRGVPNIVPPRTESERVTLAYQAGLNVSAPRFDASHINQRKYFRSMPAAHGAARMLSPIRLCTSRATENHETPVSPSPSLELNA